MTEKGKDFIRAISSDESLKKEFEEKAQGIETKDGLRVTLEFAKSKGYDISESDITPDEGYEIDEEEFAAVAGGGGCGCAFAGGGGGDGMVCSCAGDGNGRVWSDPCTNNGIELSTSQGVCMCLFAGGGGTKRH